MKNILKILSESDARPVQLLLGLLLMVWGVFCLYPSGMYTASPIFAALLSHAPEQWWGVAQVLIGGGAIIALAIDNRPARRIFAFAMTAYTGYLAGAFAAQPVRSLAPATQGIICLTSIWVLSRVPLDEGIAQYGRSK